MRKIFIQKKQRYEFSYPVSVVLLILFSVMLTYMVFYLQYYDTESIKYGFENAGLAIFFLNFLPVLLFTLLVYFIGSRISIAMFSSAFLFCILALVNRFKIIFRLDPLFYSDFQVATEVFSIIPTLGTKVIIIFAIGILALAAAGVLAVKFIRNKRLPVIARVLGGVLTIIICIILNSTVYSNDEMYDSLPVDGNPFFQVANYNTKGFTYSFIHQYNANKTQKPYGYNVNNLFDAMKDYPANMPDEGIKPHIIMVMGEGFSDISESPAISFKNHADPLANFKSLKKQGLSGHILVPCLGGGTTDTEFDVLTGMSKREIESVTYAYRLINKPTENFASYLGDIGYRNIFLHPGDSWFYNRINVYEYLGFHELYFNDYDFFKDAPLKGNYMNEESTIDCIIDLFENKRIQSPGTPIFEFCVTIQNHGAYEEKYRDWQVNFDSTTDLTPSEVSTLSNYFLGTHDQDIQLKRLSDYMNSLDEPAVLLYYGDHMPSIPVELLSKLEVPFDFEGDFYQRTALYRTPYLIWQNDCYRDMVDFKTAASSDWEFISTSYLGAYLLELMGYGEISEFFNFLNYMRTKMPVITKYEFITQEGYKNIEQLSPHEDELIRLYKHWIFYMMNDK